MFNKNAQMYKEDPGRCDETKCFCLLPVEGVYIGQVNSPAPHCVHPHDILFRVTVKLQVSCFMLCRMLSWLSQ